MEKFSTKKFLFVLLIYALFFSCVSEKTNQTNPKEILIGCIANLSGDAEYFGQQTKNGYLLAVEKWNANSGVLGGKSKLFFFDDKANPAVAREVFLKLIQNYHVHAIEGSVMSKCSLPGAEVCQSFNIPMITPTSTNPQVTAVGDCI